eukprot:scaffold2145_cov309-Prasinococcus_capsulatus_cf.AAC.6
MPCGGAIAAHASSGRPRGTFGDTVAAAAVTGITILTRASRRRDVYADAVEPVLWLTCTCAMPRGGRATRGTSRAYPVAGTALPTSHAAARGCLPAGSLQANDLAAACACVPGVGAAVPCGARPRSHGVSCMPDRRHRRRARAPSSARHLPSQCDVPSAGLAATVGNSSASRPKMR